MVGQIYWEYEARDENMACYLTMVEARHEKLDEWAIKRIPWEKNGKIDALAGVVIPNDEKQAHKLRIQTACYTLKFGQLFKQSFGGPYLRCLSEVETQYVLAELHEGICGNHSSGPTLAHHVYSLGYY